MWSAPSCAATNIFNSFNIFCPKILCSEKFGFQKSRASKTMCSKNLELQQSRAPKIIFFRIKILTPLPVLCPEGGGPGKGTKGPGGGGRQGFLPTLIPHARAPTLTEIGWGFQGLIFPLLGWGGGQVYALGGGGFGRHPSRYLRTPHVVDPSPSSPHLSPPFLQFETQSHPKQHSKRASGHC